MTSSSRHYYVIMKLLYVITSFLFATCVAETWHELNGVEYFIYRGQKQNFSSAESFCEEKNASLVLIKSKQIQDFLAEKIGNSTDRPHSFYIGLLRINGTKHGFQWIDGTPLTFTQWRNREPNNKLQMEDCVQMGRRGRLDATYSWNDMPCHSNTKVICQRPTKEKVTTSSVIVTSATTVTTQVSLDEKLIKSSTVKDGTVLPNTSDTETLTNFPTTSNPTTLYGTLVKMSTVENTPPQTDHTSSFYTVEFNPTSSEPLPTSTIDGKIETVKLTTQQMLRSSTKTQTIPASTTVGT
uniref:C-type lectin domain-containing protein n=3 Tax=Ciona intestinalis TaxID=7719 RepID=F6XAV8_CIOIN